MGVFEVANSASVVKITQNQLRSPRNLHRSCRTSLDYTDPLQITSNPLRSRRTRLDHTEPSQIMQNSSPNAMVTFILEGVVSICHISFKIVSNLGQGMSTNQYLIHVYTLSLIKTHKYFQNKGSLFPNWFLPGWMSEIFSWITLRHFGDLRVFFAMFSPKVNLLSDSSAL